MINYDSYLVDINNYEPEPNEDESKIGEGRFGKVMRMRKKDTDEIYAIRIFNSNPDIEQLIMRETETLITVRSHSAICRFFGYSTKSSYEMVFEYLKKGSLQDIFNEIEKKKLVPHWNGLMKSKTIFGTACAMLHLHNHNIFHRYLTPGCILYDENYEPHLTDFFFSRRFDNSIEFTVINNNKEVSFYQAPEIHTISYDRCVDLFSYGMILYHIVSGKLPFDKNTASYMVLDKIVKGIRPEIPSDCNKRLKRLISDLWKHSPKDRPQFIDVVKALYVYDEKLFGDINDTDMENYKEYRERILQSTFLTDEDIQFLKAPALLKQDKDLFKRTYDSAEKGNLESIIKLARMFELGIGTDINVNAAIEWYQIAAQKNNPEALYKIANFYAVKNEVFGFSESEYLKYLKKSAELNYIPAIIDYSYQLIKNERNIEEAINKLKKVADPPNNYKEAQYRLAYIYEKQGNITEALKYYDLSRKQGFTQASSNYALILLEGQGIKQNIDEGLKILKQAASEGLAMANCNLGLIYEKGKYGQAIDGEKAWKYYNIALDKGLPNAMTSVGKAYYRGKIANYTVKQDSIRAARLFETAANKDDPEGLYSWGLFQLKGYGGTPINMDDAIFNFKRSASLGFPHAMMMLYSLYNEGINGVRDTERAAQYLNEAARQGFPAAIKILHPSKS